MKQDQNELKRKELDIDIKNIEEKLMLDHCFIYKMFKIAYFLL